MLDVRVIKVNVLLCTFFSFSGFHFRQTTFSKQLSRAVTSAGKQIPTKAAFRSAEMATWSRGEKDGESTNHLWSDHQEMSEVSWKKYEMQKRMQWGLCEYVVVHTFLGGSPVILWISLDGKPKWLLLKFGYHDVMCTSPIANPTRSLDKVTLR